MGKFYAREAYLSGYRRGGLSVRSTLSRHSDFVAVLVLFISFRLMLLVTFSPGGFLTNYTDHFYYYSIAQLSESGHYPLIDYWYEYPPLSAYTSLAVYTLAKVVHPGFLHYTLTLATLMLVFESANLVLLYLLARQLWSESIAIKTAWIYSCLLFPIFYWWGSLELLVLFFCLLCLYLFVVQRHSLAGVALGLGVLAKYVPVVLLAPILRCAPGRKLKARYVIITCVVSVLGFFPFLVLSPQQVVNSLRVLLSLPPWQTIWALIAGDFGTGGLGPVEVHLDPASVPRAVSGSYLPLWLLCTVAIAIWFLSVLFRRRITTAQKRGVVILSAMTICLFFLCSKGWSPDWLILLLPFILLVLPNWRGILYCLTLSAIGILEWPVFFVAAPDRKEIFALIVVARTLVFILLLANLYKELGKDVVSAPSY
jgi:hypothetical protein